MHSTAEDCRGLLIEGRDRPAPILCGHQPAYYQGFYERYGFSKDGEDLLAYAFDIDPESPKLQRLFRLAERVRQRNPQFTLRIADLADMDNELDRIVYLQNRALAHFPNFVPYSRNDIETMIRPLLDVVDIDLVVRRSQRPAGWLLPAVPNFNGSSSSSTACAIRNLRYLRYRISGRNACRSRAPCPAGMLGHWLAVCSLPRWWARHRQGYKCRSFHDRRRQPRHLAACASHGGKDL
jgi:hypothetical protein